MIGFVPANVRPLCYQTDLDSCSQLPSRLLLAPEDVAGDDDLCHTGGEDEASETHKVCVKASACKRVAVCARVCKSVCVCGYEKHACKGVCKASVCKSVSA